MAAVTTRVFLLDDHEVVRRGLRELVDAEDDLEVVGEAGSAEEAHHRIPVASPHVAVLDVRLPDGSGIEVCREIRSRSPEIACVMLTSFADDEAVYAAILAGAAGYLLKQIRGTDLIDGIRRRPRRVAVGPGRDHPGPRTTAPSGRRRRVGGADTPGAQHPGPHRQGLTNRQIGEQMFLAEKTVKNYVSNVLSKLGMSRRTEAAAYAAPRRATGSRPGHG